MIKNEDYRETVKHLGEVDYVFTVPPDFDELGLNPKTQLKDYYEFIYELLYHMTNCSDLITIAITDRKFDGGIIPKHMVIMEHMIEHFKWKLLSHKIWHKSPKRNLYRLNYTHIMTFYWGEKPKQTHHNLYEYDVYIDKEDKFHKYPYGIALGVVDKLIKNFQEVEVVYDPFMGSGTTAVACVMNGKRYVGSEINKEYFDLSQARLKQQVI